jgi:hypothetical protein
VDNLSSPGETDQNGGKTTAGSGKKKKNLAMEKVKLTIGGRETPPTVRAVPLRAQTLCSAIAVRGLGPKS